MARASEKRKRRMADASKRAAMSGVSSCLRVPQDLPTWQPTKGKTYTIDIVPYAVTKKQAKFAKMNVAEPGDLYYERTYFTHRNVGANQDMVVCPANTFGEKCPPCEERGRLSQDPKYGKNSDEVKALWTSQRMCMMVYVHEEKEKGLQFFDVSNHAFGKALDLKIGNARKEMKDKLANFFDPSKEGFSLRVIVSEAPMGGGGSYNVFTIDEFIPRKKDLPAELVEQAEAIDLAAVPAALTYKELKKKFYMESEDEDKPSRNGHAEADDDEEIEEDDDTDEEAEGDDEGEIEVGDTVKGTYRGKVRTGIVKKLKGTLAFVGVRGLEKPWTVEIDELTLVDEEDEEAEDDDEEGEGEDDDEEGEGEDDDEEGEGEDDDGESDDEDAEEENEDDESEEEESDDENEDDDEEPLEDSDEEETPPRRKKPEAKPKRRRK